MVKKSKIIYALLATVLMAGCASQIGPSGGDVDSTPPKILESFPADGTTNFAKNYFEILFSEYVEHRWVQNAIFISPALENGFEYDWSGKTLRVDFRDTLQSNTTYTITIGTDVADLNNGNKMEEAFTFAFSTGNKIDKGKISGKIYSTNPDGIMVLAYQTEGDIDPIKEKPNYISQVGKNGNYSMVGLRDGNYKVLALRDKLKDMLYQRNEDEFGIQFKNIFLKDTSNVISNNDYFTTIEDTIPPKLSSAFMKDRNHIIVEFSEAIDSTKLKADNFYLVDTVKNQKYVPKYFFKYDAKPNQFYLGFDDTTSFQDYFLVANNFVDLSNNSTGIDRIQFIYKAEKDTFPIQLVKAGGELPEDKVDFENPIIKISFNDGIDSTDMVQRLSVEDSKKGKLNFNLHRNDDASFILKMSSKLKPAADYHVLFNAKGIKDFSQKSIDTVYSVKFTTCNELDFTGVSGDVITNDSLDTYVVIEKVESRKLNYNQKLSTKHKFDFKRILPGKYLLWSYKDRNKNSKYDHGTIYPYNLSEQFKYYPDTLNLRARWPVGDVKVIFDK